MFAVLLAPLQPLAADADPLPAVYTGRSHGDILSLDLDLAGLGVSGSIGHSTAAVDSTATTRAEASGGSLHDRGGGDPD